METVPVPGFSHQTVLLDAAVDALNIHGRRTDGVYVDGTFGRGGHSRLILSRLSLNGRLFAFDRDPAAVSAAQELADSRFEIVHDNVAALGARLAERGIDRVDGVLLDLGLSSPQVDDAARGFSFRSDGPLDMRMDTTRGESAAEWLASVDQKILARVIKDYGEERFAVPIAKAIAAGRLLEPISRTRQLAELVARAVKTREKGKNPATRTFQAIRIHVNQELEALEVALEAAFARMAYNGRLVVISFHSLEDRIVKQRMAQRASVPQFDRRLPLRAADLPQPDWNLRGRVMPDLAEIAANPRARSAVMRIAERRGQDASHATPGDLHA